MTGRVISQKNNGLKTVGIGNVVCHFLAKDVLEVVGEEVNHACGKGRLCEGLAAGIARGVPHQICLVRSNQFSVEEWALLIIDVHNNFNKKN